MGEAYLFGNGGASKAPPEFTYTGEYEVIDDGSRNWRIKFFTSGDLTFTKLNGAKCVDVFLVGGGGAGGTSGYSNNPRPGGSGGFTKTRKGIYPTANIVYPIVIGAGGASAAANGGQTSALNITVDGGGGDGGKGGSGGGNGYAVTGGGYGGSDGSDGWGISGNGQGTTTREFGEADGDLYAGGGGGGTSNYNGVSYSGGAGGAGGGGDGGWASAPGTPNTGGGGGGAVGWYTGFGAGGSGIVVIRNHREA